MSTVAAVKLWGTTVGAVALPDEGDVAAFEYARGFLKSNIEIAPLTMPLSDQVYQFPSLPRRTFHGLPGLLADSLPDWFGNAVIEAWLATQGRSPASFNAVERLCYTGTRGMGALEFEPATGPQPSQADRIQVEQLVALASEILTHRDDLRANFSDAGRGDSLRDILRVGTSAGGARAKAVIAWNPETNEVRSGQVAADKGFQHWLLKFDGVSNNRDKELDDPQGYGAIEYAYANMARAAGITMSDCRLLEENGRRHFMTRRFDRPTGNDKLHMQSLGALAHLDFNSAGAHSYEQALQIVRRFGLPMADVEQLFRRMVFNVVARNHDDHVKNIAFLMDRRGQWSLAPAFDVIYAYNPNGPWTGQHQMTINAKRDGFTLRDFQACARSASMKRGRAKTILTDVQSAVAHWRDYAADARVDPAQRERIHSTLRLAAFPSN